MQIGTVYQVSCDQTVRVWSPIFDSSVAQAVQLAADTIIELTDYKTGDYKGADMTDYEFTTEDGNKFYCSFIPITFRELSPLEQLARLG